MPVVVSLHRPPLDLHRWPLDLPAGPMNPQQAAAALAWINDIEAQEAADEWERAAAAVVITHDPMSGNLYATGPFIGVVDALAYANRHAEALNTPPSDDPPFRVVVLPLLTP